MESFEKIILRKLFESIERVDIYFFHEKYLLSPSQINLFISKYGEKKFIEYNDGFLKLNKEGREWIVENIDKVYYKSKKYFRKITSKEGVKNTEVKKYSWKRIPKEFKEKKKVKINEIIKVNFSRNDIKSFLLYEKQIKKEK